MPRDGEEVIELVADVAERITVKIGFFSPPDDPERLLQERMVLAARVEQYRRGGYWQQAEALRNRLARLRL